MTGQQLLVNPAYLFLSGQAITSIPGIIATNSSILEHPLAGISMKSLQGVLYTSRDHEPRHPIWSPEG
jgi:hypothetical protein